MTNRDGFERFLRSRRAGSRTEARAKVDAGEITPKVRHLTSAEAGDTFALGRAILLALAIASVGDKA